MDIVMHEACRFLINIILVGLTLLSWAVHMQCAAVIITPAYRLLPSPSEFHRAAQQAMRIRHRRRHDAGELSNIMLEAIMTSYLMPAARRLPRSMAVKYHCRTAACGYSSPN